MPQKGDTSALFDKAQVKWQTAVSGEELLKLWSRQMRQGGCPACACLILFSLVAPAAWAGEPESKIESMEGTWKLVTAESKTGFPWYTSMSFAGNRNMEFRKDGTTTEGDSWTFDSKNQTITLAGYGLSTKYNVERSGGNVIMSYSLLGNSIRFTLTKVDGLDDRKPDDKATTVNFEDEVVDKTVFTEIIETLPGLPKKFTVQREFLTSVTAVGTVGAEINGEAKIGNTMVATIAAGFKTKIETSLGVTLGKKDSVTETYELDGKEHVKLKVKWVERYRKGVATMPDGSKISFLVCVGLRTVPEKLK
jgi:hypothetical protein